MPIETRIFKNTRKTFIFLKKKFYFFKKNFSISVLFLFIGFFIGNVFGTFSKLVTLFYSLGWFTCFCFTFSF